MHGKCIRRFKVEETILNDAYEVCKIVNNMPRQQLCQCQAIETKKIQKRIYI